ncbi:MAG: YbhB/YbcL family Raf kinase inhibitor-like protein [Chlorobiales bacterium]|nr:YbhB/YbcL family Raf kinase inhibitor-like protein [Chlorobiales bacterium]
MLHPEWKRYFLANIMAILAGLLLVFRPAAARTGGTMTFTISSTAFANMGSMPTRYTCEGEELSPPLSWSGLPTGTRSIVLIVDDPDAPDPAAPKMTWVHWLVYNMPPSMNGLQEGSGNRPLPKGILEGIGSGKKGGYHGPCPPIGTHRYFFKLYALDTVLPDLGSPDKDRLLKAMQGHVIGEAVVIGTYHKMKP